MTVHRIARYAGRPLLMTQEAARQLAERALALDPRALKRERLARAPGAFLSKLGVAALFRPQALEDDLRPSGETAPPGSSPGRRLRPHGYAPSYAGEPEFEGYGWTLIDGIACLDIEGALLDRGCVSISDAMFWGYDTIAASLREAVADHRVRGVFIRMDSPGGVVAGGLEALTADMRALRETGDAAGKPIFVFADCAASAAYWIAAQADRIFAPAVGMVGSIGAVIVHQDISGALDKEGVKVEAIQFGAKKTDGAWWKPLSEEARADLQAEIDAIGERFVADVTAGREFLSRAAQIATQAACYMASHPDAERSGQALGLVDEIAREDEAFAALHDHAFKSVPAPRRAPAPAPAAKVEAGAQTESETMRKSKEARVAAVLSRKAMDDTEKLDAIRKILDEEEEKTAEGEEEEETTAEGEEEEPTAEGEEEEPAAEGEEEEPAAEGEEEEETAKKARATGRAIMALPEARGREKLAAELAFTPRMSVATAKRVLSASPRESRLAGRVHDPKLGAGGDAGARATSEDEKAASFVRECVATARGTKVKS